MIGQSWHWSVKYFWIMTKSSLLYMSLFPCLGAFPPSLYSNVHFDLWQLQIYLFIFCCVITLLSTFNKIIKSFFSDCVRVLWPREIYYWEFYAPLNFPKTIIMGAWLSNWWSCPNCPTLGCTIVEFIKPVLFILIKHVECFEWTVWGFRFLLLTAN